MSIGNSTYSRNIEQSVTRLKGTQVDDDDNAPLLPPDILKDVLFKFKTADEARSLYNYYKGEGLSNRRMRKFVFGSLHKDLFPGYFEVDQEAMGDVDILVEDQRTKSQTTIGIRSAAKDAELMSGIVELGESMPGTGNCRRLVGDSGSMYGLGYRSKARGEIYVQTKKARTNAAMTSLTQKVGPFLEEKYPEVLQDIRAAEKRGGSMVRPLDAMGGESGPGSSIMISRNLGNSSHYDYSDGSASCSIWAEKCKGRARNWYFVLPNLSINGSKGVVIRLRHGVSISWDGRIIRHCSSVTDVGADNNVYGCMFGSCRD